MVLLGYVQAHKDLLDHMDKNESSNARIYPCPYIDPREITLAKYVEIFTSDEMDENDIKFEYSLMKDYGQICIMNQCFSQAENGYVNNCPFIKGKNDTYTLDLGLICSKYKGLLHQTLLNVKYEM